MLGSAVKLGVQAVEGEMDKPETYKHHLVGIDDAFINADCVYTFPSPARLALTLQIGASTTYLPLTPSLHIEANSMKVRQRWTPATIPRWDTSYTRHWNDRPRENPDAGISTLRLTVSYYRIITTPSFYLKTAFCWYIWYMYTVADYIKALGISATFLYTCPYIENCIKFGQLKKEEGSWVLHYPCPDETVLPVFAVEQTGAWVLPAFKNPEEWRGESNFIGDNVWICSGKDVAAVSEHITVAGLAKVFSEVSGKHIEAGHVSEDTFVGSGKEAFQKTVTMGRWVNYYYFWRKVSRAQ
jgi:hypothetical protein